MSTIPRGASTGHQWLHTSTPCASIELRSSPTRTQATQRCRDSGEALRAVEMVVDDALPALLRGGAALARPVVVGGAVACPLPGGRGLVGLEPLVAAPGLALGLS